MLRRTPREARIYAEAQAQVDAGASVDAVLAGFPKDAAWLGPMLDVGLASTVCHENIQADPAFEQSLRQAFLAAARRPSFVQPAPVPAGRIRTVMAGSAVAAAVGGIGVLTYGLATADQAVPGEWNYAFKQWQEGLEYRLASDNGKVDVQIRQTEARVWEIKQLSERRDVSEDNLAKLANEVQALAEIAEKTPLDDSQRAKVRGIAETANITLTDTTSRQPQLEPKVTTTKRAVDEAVVAAGAGTVTTISVPTATASPIASATVEPSGTLTPAPSGTPVPEATPTATAVDPTSTPAPSATATAVETPEASPTAQTDSR